MDHFATALQEMQQHSSPSSEDHEMASARDEDLADVKPPRTESPSEDTSMTSTAHNSDLTQINNSVGNNDTIAPSPYPNQQNFRHSIQQNLQQPNFHPAFNPFASPGLSLFPQPALSPFPQPALNLIPQQPVNYLGQHQYPLDNMLLPTAPFPQPVTLPPLNPAAFQYRPPQPPGQMLPPRLPQPIPQQNRPVLRVLDPFEPLPAHLPNAAGLPFTPANLANLPPFIKERDTATFSLPGSLLHVPGLLFPNATFTITLTTSNVPMRVGGDGLAKFSQLLPAAARSAMYHLHLVFRDWPAGQVAEFADDGGVSGMYVQKMKETVQLMPGHEVWFFERFNTMHPGDGLGGQVMGGTCIRVLRAFRGHGAGKATMREVVMWMRSRGDVRVPVDEGGGRVIEFATGLYFAPRNQRITEGWVGERGACAGQGGGGGVSSGTGQLSDGDEEEEEDEEEDDTTATKTEAIKAETSKVATGKKTTTKGRKRSKSRAPQWAPAVTVGSSSSIAAPSLVERRVLREGLRPRSQPANYAKPWWDGEDGEGMGIDLDDSEDERKVEVKQEGVGEEAEVDVEEESEEEVEDEMMGNHAPMEEIYDYDP
ncbi:hypothetical protein QBC39DRAFT_386821 [Podospora conica]|nr:hypothetical protein QBC39DRAFT_386821 [Schizothecium conicum]